MKRFSAEKEKISPEIMEDLEKIKSILCHYGATKIILYGSLVRGDYKADSDIDMCYEGLPDENYFRAMAECIMNTRKRVSILDFESIKGYLKQRISKEGKLLYEHK
ncbi:TPA: hypothetical protein DCX16_00565 [bacterium]|nr:hypothetical protein [bacterium]